MLFKYEEPKRDDFEIAPVGLWDAICCDFVDLGMQEVEFEGNRSLKHLVRYCFLLDERNSKGKPYWVGSKRFPLTLHQKAGLRKFLGSWRGKPLSDSECAAGIEFEDYVLKQARLSIQHLPPREGYTSPTAIIDAIVLPGRTSPVLQGLIKESGYIRVKDRPPKDGEGGRGNGGRSAETTQFNQGQRAPAQRQPQAEEDDQGLPF